MRHVDIEKMILGLDDNDLSHIINCKYCQSLYDSFNYEVDERAIEAIESNVRSRVFEKFYQFKKMALIDEDDKYPENVSLNSRLGLFSIVLSGMTVVLIIFTMFIVTSNILNSTYSYKYAGSLLELGNVSEKSLLDKVSLSSNGTSLIISLPDGFEGNLALIPSSNFNEVVLKIGGIVYKFQASEVKILIDNGKVWVNGEELEKSTGSLYQNKIYLKSGEVFEGNLIEIKDNFIIFETRNGRKSFSKKDIEKIKYSD
ncbi:MAG: hypothetical protein N2712_00670 [Brevinematales bacterium]|nr:hypothetical protein [Brevinematales bacterium]